MLRGIEKINNMKLGFYPGNLDIDDLHQKMKPFRKSTLIRFISLFYSTLIKNKFRRKIPLNSTRLNNEISQNYKKLIDGLIEYGLIEPGGKYSKGAHSNYYGLTDKYFNNKEITTVQLKPKIKTNISLAKQKKKNQELINSRLRGEIVDLTFEEKLSDRYGLLTRWFYDPRLEFDYELAQKILKKIQKSKAKKSLKKYQHAYPAVERFYRKDWNIRFDKNGRLHTNLTMLPSKFRECISFGGKPLIGVDVSNTQPLLLADLCDKFTLISLAKQGTIDVDSDTLNEFIAYLDSSPSDLELYSDLVKCGEFYEYMVELYPQFSRRVIKMNILKIINDKGSSSSYNRELVRKAFKATFPTVYKLLELLKSKSHKQSSKLLMQIESSRFVIWFAQDFYYKGNDDIPLYTIHDCVYTTVDYIELVTNSLVGFYKQYCGEFLPTKPN